MLYQPAIPQSREMFNVKLIFYFFNFCEFAKLLHRRVTESSSGGSTRPLGPIRQAAQPLKANLKRNGSDN